MSYFVYVSHVDPIHGLQAVRDCMHLGYYPFMPQLNKLVPGRKDPEWENYYKMWLFKCDCILLTESCRPNERDWAMKNKIPICLKVKDIASIQVAHFKELGEEFGRLLARRLPKNQVWRKMSRKDSDKILGRLCGLGCDPLDVGLAALKCWDMQHR